MRNEMEIAAVTHVAVVDEHEVFVLVHMECESGGRALPGYLWCAKKCNLVQSRLGTVISGSTGEAGGARTQSG
jgi:hypothetical protein